MMRTPWPAGAAGLMLASALSLAAGQPVSPVPAPSTARPAAPVEPLAADLREEVHRIPVTLTDADGRSATRTIALTLFRPAGDGPFPLAVVGHGRAIGKLRQQQGRQRFEVLARYLVGKGFVVAVPTRVGYGETYGDFDPESSGGCQVMQLEPAAVAASEQVLAAVNHARSLPYVDATRWIAIGQSVGGLATLAVAWRQPAGLMAAVNFSGGAGGNPDRRPGDPCRPSQTEALLAAKATGAAVPVLWLYWENDKFWGPDVPRRWAAAWTGAGGRLEFHLLPPVGNDGHAGMGRDMDGWVPIVESYLARQGFARSGRIVPPPPSDYARIDAVDRVPVSPAFRESAYTAFLAAKTPRAFAVGPNGAWGWASGDWALGRALGNCQSRRGALCRLYAVDDDVVWTPTANQNSHE